jgi:hypothetical protein
MSLFTRLIQQFRIALKLPSHDVLQPRHDVASGMLGSHRTTGNDTMALDNLLSRDLFGIGDQH